MKRNLRCFSGLHATNGLTLLISWAKVATVLNFFLRTMLNMPIKSMLCNMLHVFDSLILDFKFLKAALFFLKLWDRHRVIVFQIWDKILANIGFWSIYFWSRWINTWTQCYKQVLSHNYVMSCLSWEI